MREEWIECSLEELTLFALGGDWGKAQDFHDPNYELAYCIRGAEFKNWDKKFGKTASLRRLKKNSIEKRNLILGDILVEISGGGPDQPVGRTEVISQSVLSNFKNKPVVCTNFLRLLRPSTLVSSNYINWFLKHFYSTGKIIAYQAGSNNLRNLRFNEYLTINVPLAPLPEQRAIVAKIEELFSDLDKGIADLKKAQEQLVVYRQAVLKKAFEGELTKEWREHNKTVSSFEVLKELASKRKEMETDMNSIYRKKVSHGFSFIPHPKIPTWSKGTLDKLIYIAARIGWRGLKKSEYTQSGPLFLSVHSLNYGKYVQYSEAYHISDQRYLESPEIQIEEGDVLLCKDGAGIGKIGIVKNLPARATVNSSLLIIRGMGVLHQDFLYYLFSGPKLQSIVFQRITGSATPHLFQNDIRKFELPIPPMEEQIQIIHEIESRLSVCDMLEQSILEGSEKAKALRQSILKKAFEGKLLSEEEIEKCKEANDYEPASVLLERIKAEKPDAQKRATKEKCK